MKKLFLLLLALCTLLTLAACGETDHSFAAKWESDATDHWHVCEDEGCTEIADKAAHTFTTKGVTKAAVGTTAGEETLMCSVCAYTQTKPFAAITAEAWNALFAFENVKVTGAYADQTVEAHMNGNIVFMTDGENEAYITREDVLVSIDFSAKLADFSTFDGKIYDATTVTIGSDVFKNVKITVDSGKITSIAYTVEYDGGEPEDYTFTFSDWGNVTVSMPSLTAEQWTNAVSSMTLNNYSVNVVTKPAEGEWTYEWFQFNGNEYYHWINYTTNQSGDTIGDNGTVTNAGTTMTPGIAALMALDPSKFTVYGEYYVYTESVSNFTDSLATNASMGIALKLNSDDQIVEMTVMLSDGSTLDYEFFDYGDTTPGSPSYGTTHGSPIDPEI